MIKSSSTIIFFDKHRFVAIHSWFENEVIYSLLNHNYFFKIQIEYFSQPEPLNPLFRKDETNSNHSPKSPSVSPVTCSASPVTSKVTDESP